MCTESWWGRGVGANIWAMLLLGVPSVAEVADLFVPMRILSCASTSALRAVRSRPRCHVRQQRGWNEGPFHSVVLSTGAEVGSF
jgi:hypothetical protein